MCNLYSHTEPVDGMRRHFDITAARHHLGNQASLPQVYQRYEAPFVRFNRNGQRPIAGNVEVVGGIVVFPVGYLNLALRIE